MPRARAAFPPRLPGAFCLVLTLSSAWILPEAGAQDTRRELLTEARKAKALALEPYQPKKLEKALTWVDESRFLQRLFDPYEGFHLRFGGLTKGGGLGTGVGYRNWFAADHARFESFVIGSWRNYWFAGTGITLPELADERLEIGAHAYLRYWPRERFFGLSRGSQKADRVGFLREGHEFRGDVTYRPQPWLRIGAITAYRTELIGEGHLPGYPSIEEVFTDVDAPGLDAQPDYWWSGSFVEVDYRDQPANVRDGGLFRVDYEYWQDQDSLGYTFRRVRGEVLQAFPVFDKKRVFLVRAIGESTDSPAGNTVPFYQMPTIGGSTSLRGYTDFRFRDRNVVLFNAEYRWEAFSGLDMALFGDWGDVAPDWDALDFGHLKSSYGLGFRFNTYRSVFLRFDLAHSSEDGVRITTSFSGPF